MVPANTKQYMCQFLCQSVFFATLPSAQRHQHTVTDEIRIDTGACILNNSAGLTRSIKMKYDFLQFEGEKRPLCVDNLKHKEASVGTVFRLMTNLPRSRVYGPNRQEI
jgi:hypothetical protein